MLGILPVTMLDIFNKAITLLPPYKAVYAGPDFRVRLEKKSGFIAYANYLGLKRGTSWLPKLSEDGTFCLYDSETLQLINRPRNPHHWFRTTCVSPVDAIHIASGGADGTIVIARAKHGRELLRLDAHRGSVVGLDVWYDYMVSTDDQKSLKIFHLEGTEAVPVATFTLQYVPHVVKFVAYKNRLLVLLSRRDRNEIELYSMVDGYLGTLKMWDEHSCGQFTLEDVALNTARTHYAVAASYIDSESHEPRLLVTTGCFFDTTITKSFILRGHFSEAKIAYNPTCSVVYVSDSLGIVHCFEPDSGYWQRSVNKHKGALRCMHVDRIGDHDCIITEGTDGETFLWKMGIAEGC